MTTGTAIHTIQTGATFLTGVECSTSAGSTSAADRLGPDLVHLRSQASHPQLYFSTSTSEHGTDVEAAGYAMLHPDITGAALAGLAPVGRWRAVRAEVLVQDFGVGTARITWAPVEPGGAAVRTTPDDVDLLAQVTAEFLAPLVARSVRALTVAFPAAPQDDGVVALLKSVEHDLPPWGTVLWVWSHLHCSATDHAAHAARVAAVFCPNDATVVVHRDHTYAAATSVCITTSRPDLSHDGVALARVIPRQDAWWALLWALDRALLALQLRVDGSMSTGSIAALVHRARQIERVTARVHLLRSRVDSVLVNAGAREFAAWRALSTAWDLELRIDVVQRKLVYLQSSYQSVLSETSRRRADQISLMVYLFTAVSVIASAVAVVQYAQGPQSSAPTARIAVVVTCIVAALAAVVSTLRAQRIRRERVVERRRWTTAVQAAFRRHGADGGGG